MVQPFLLPIVKDANIIFSPFSANKTFLVSDRIIVSFALIQTWYFSRLNVAQTQAALTLPKWRQSTGVF